MNNDFLFVLKCVIKQKPFTTLVSMMAVMCWVFGMQLQIFESPMDPVTGNNYGSIYNCMWNVVITLSTEGYGDISANTFFGRLVAIIICFWGLLIVSLVVMTVTD